MQSLLRELLVWGAQVLGGAGIDNAKFEARLLLGEALGVPDWRVIYGSGVKPTEQQIAWYKAAIARRNLREPVSHILQRREFWSLTFNVSADVLDPRADSETVVELALEHIVDRTQPLRIIDIGTGSGCLLIALLSELPNATGVGIDISPRALAIARSNAIRHDMENRISYFCGNWLDAYAGTADIILSNPPYIPSGEIAGLQLEVREFDPPAALDGGKDGLDAYRNMAPNLRKILDRTGFCIFEIGSGQERDITEIMLEWQLTLFDRRRDFSGFCRALAFRGSA